jgi:peptidoglycan/xylan/chitin deacetylase (PgdA/CDA1 family)
MKRYRNLLKRVFFFFVSLSVAVGDWFGRNINRWCKRPNGASCVVLCYHSVPSRQEGRFRTQMQILRRLCVTIPADHRSELETDRRYAVITFDDGFVSVLKHAEPVLKRHKLPFTLFIPAGRLGARPDWIDEENHPDRLEKVMDEEMLRGIAAGDVLIGSHSMTHAYLTRLDEENAFRELADSKRVLERITGAEVSLLAFPHGFYNNHLLELSRKLGYSRVFTLDPHPALARPDEFVTGRIDVGPHLLNWEFQLVLMSAYRWLPVYYDLKTKLRSWSRGPRCSL